MPLILVKEGPILLAKDMELCIVCALRGEERAATHYEDWQERPTHGHGCPMFYLCEKCYEQRARQRANQSVSLRIEGTVITQHEETHPDTGQPITVIEELELTGISLVHPRGGGIDVTAAVIAAPEDTDEVTGRRG